LNLVTKDINFTYPCESTQFAIHIVSKTYQKL